jgi:mannose-6-phosphate isomerase-like protein (cupin superfamily)
MSSRPRGCNTSAAAPSIAGGALTNPGRAPIVPLMPVETIDPARYDLHLDDKYGHLKLIDIPAEVAAHEPWFNQTLTTVNDAVVRLGILEGEFHWHKHDDQDEFFLVLDGQLLIDVEGSATVTLDRHQGYTVPKGIVHRTRAPRRTVVVMVESAGVRPTGD